MTGISTSVLLMILQNRSTHVGEMFSLLLARVADLIRRSRFPAHSRLLRAQRTRLHNRRRHVNLSKVCACHWVLSEELFESQGHHTRFGLKIYLKKLIPGHIYEICKAAELLSWSRLKETSTILWPLVVNVARGLMVRSSAQNFVLAAMGTWGVMGLRLSVSLAYRIEVVSLWLRKGGAKSHNSETAGWHCASCCRGWRLAQVQALVPVLSSLTRFL